MLKFSLFLSDFKFDNILWVIFLINKGFSLLYIVFLEAIFYSFYAVVKYLMFFNEQPSKIFIIISPLLVLISYIFIYVFTSSFLVFVAFLLLAFSYYTYHDNITQRLLSISEKENSQRYRYEPVVFLAVITSNYFGGLLANISWEIFYFAAILMRIATIAFSPIIFRSISKIEKPSIIKQQKRNKINIKLPNTKAIKLFFSRVIIVSVFAFLYIFIAYRLRINFVSPYHVGLLYATEALISMISLRYFFHFEALFGSYFGKFITAIAFFTLTTLVFSDSFTSMALALIFLSASRYLNESLTNLDILYTLKTDEIEQYLSNEDLFFHIVLSIFMILFALLFTYFGSTALMYAILLSSFIYFALLIF